MSAAFLALAGAAAFAGAAFYINVAEQPARLRLADGPLLQQWKPAYHRGFAMQASLAALSGAIALYAAYAEQSWEFAAAGALMLLNWPYTVVAILPTNLVLERTPDSEAGPRSRALIRRWGWLHAVRTLLGLCAVGLILYGLR